MNISGLLVETFNNTLIQDHTGNEIILTEHFTKLFVEDKPCQRMVCIGSLQIIGNTV